MISRIIDKIICVLFTERNSNLVTRSSRVENKTKIPIITTRPDNVIYFFTHYIYNYCRKQIRFNLGDWWIMHLHHIGLPPTTNRYSKLSVSGNPLIKTELM